MPAGPGEMGLGELGESLVPAGPGEMGLGESISHLMGREGSFDEKIDAARYYKAAGNALLDSGDYEDALRKYEAGLKLVTFHERAMAMVKLPPADLEAAVSILDKILAGRERSNEIDELVHGSPVRGGAPALAARRPPARRGVGLQAGA